MTKANCLFVIFLILVLIGCNSVSEQSAPPTPPSTMSELLDVLANGGAEARIGAAGAIGARGTEAAIAVPALIENLEYVGPYQVRKAAANALGRIGSEASPAISGLIVILQNDNEVVHARRTVALALGRIGDLSAVPALAEALYEEPLDTVSDGATKQAALALEQLVGKDFVGRLGTGYTTDNESNLPVIVLNARKWWEDEGQYQKWPSLSKSN